MKAIILLVFLLIPVLKSTSQNSSLYKRITTKTGEAVPGPTPALNAERIKIVNHITVDSTIYFVYIKEFVNNKRVIDYYELTERVFLNKDRNFSWEIIVDTSAVNCVRMFTYIPGSSSHRVKTTGQDKYFGYHIFENQKNVIYEKEIPLVIIYEDDFESRKTEQMIKKQSSNNLIKSNKKDFICSKIERYILIYYIAKTLN